jgi:hypothetical protein
MKFYLDMVHHNPGESPTETKYTDPFTLKETGFNGQVLKNINLTVSYARSCPGLVEGSPEVSAWIEKERESFDSLVKNIREAGLLFFSHIDPFVIPSLITERFRNEMCDEDGISIYRSRTREIIEDMLEELFSRYPELDGLIIRTGETYLFDTPFHTGNNPIRYFHNKEHAFEEGDISVKYGNREKDLIREKEEFVYLIDFLKELICIKHGKKLIFRTWDVFEDRFHADSSYYLDITDKVEPHGLLFFSLKHTRLDFLRRVEPNPSIGRGKHKQFVEVQFQREYEGKGAYPNYFAHFLIDGFPETESNTGFRAFIRSPLVEGLFGWSRGGGWYGPYIGSEFWIDLNITVLIRWLRNTSADEESIFHHYLEELGFRRNSRMLLREISLLSSDAVLKGRYCAWGKVDKLWMRDDVIGGLKQLAGGFDSLKKSGKIDEALREKEESVRLWKEIVRLSRQVEHEDESLVQFIRVSCRYGLILFSIVEKGWRIMAAGNEGLPVSGEDMEDFERSREEYRNLKIDNPECPTLFRGQYWNWPGESLTPGMEDSIRELSRPPESGKDRKTG